MPPAGALPPELRGFRLAGVQRAGYVDAAGRQQGVAPEELGSTLLDPLALASHDLLAEINGSEAWRHQLRLFAAAYLGVHCGEVLLEGADRLGFNLLGAPLAAGGEGGDGAEQQQQKQGQQQQQRWRQFRIGFSREMRDRAAFVSMLEQMKSEVSNAAGPP